ANLGSGTFYGDPIAFKVTTGATGGMNVQWDFGNLEAVAAADPNIVNGTATTAGVQVTHRYSGLTSDTQLPITRSAKATSLSDSSVTSSTSVTLAKPAVRFGVTNYKFLFLQPNASSPAPI